MIIKLVDYTKYINKIGFKRVGEGVSQERERERKGDTRKNKARESKERKEDIFI